jgi:hypothetical protein
VVNLQKSAFGNQWYINIGFWIQAFGEVENPPESHCHIRLRITDLPMADAAQLNDALGADEPMHDEMRREIVESHIKGKLLPFLREASTLEGLLQLLREGAFRGCAVRKEVRTLVSGSPKQ